MWQIQVNDKDVRGLTLRHTKYSGDVIAEHPRLQILAQRFQLGNLAKQLDFLGTVRQLRHATLVRADFAHDARVKQSNDEFRRVSAFVVVGLRNCTLLPAIVATHVPRQYRSEEAAMA